MQYYPQTSFGWTTNLSAYKAWPSFWPPAEISGQSVFQCIRLGQSHRVSHKYMSSMCLVTEDTKILWETKLLRPPGNRRLFLRCGRDEAWTANYFGLTWMCTQELRDAIIQLLAEVHPLDCPFAIIRTDPAPGFKALVNDELLTRHRIAIELGRPKNVNLKWRYSGLNQITK